MNVDYLRISVTDRCNLNCLYCNPADKIGFIQKKDILSYEEITEIAGIFAEAGIKKIRLTGGEPLIKLNISGLVKMLKPISNIEELSMTTNGILLKDMAKELKISGLDRINISIDTLREDRFRLITRGGNINDVKEGIDMSLKAGLNPVKLNVVLLKGINDDEIGDFAGLSVDSPLIVRFIELFPVNFQLKSFSKNIVKNEEVKQKIIAVFGDLEPVNEVIGNGPAVYYKIKNSAGSIGFISSYSEDFCGKCNRIRMDSAGRIFPCLFANQVYDVKKLLRSGASKGNLTEFIENIICVKPQYKKKDAKDFKVEMSSIGG